MNSMNTKALLIIVPITLGIAATVTFGLMTHPGANVSAPVPKPAAVPAAEADTSARVNVASLAKRLEFLGDKRVVAGRPLLFEFWATWCPPCRASIAHLNELEQKYHERGLQIVGITGEDKAVVEAFRARVPMDYTVALDGDQTIAREFQVQAIPQAWLLDKDGRIIWSGHPMELDEQTLARVLPTHPAA
jgi:thiol-disulfide isomerase/thioredoxin